MTSQANCHSAPNWKPALCASTWCVKTLEPSRFSSSESAARPQELCPRSVRRESVDLSTLASQRLLLRIKPWRLQTHFRWQGKSTQHAHRTIQSFWKKIGITTYGPCFQQKDGGNKRRGQCHRSQNPNMPYQKLQSVSFFAWLQVSGASLLVLDRTRSDYAHTHEEQWFVTHQPFQGPQAFPQDQSTCFSDRSTDSLQSQSHSTPR